MRCPNCGNGWKWVAGIGAAVVVVVGLIIALASGSKSAVPSTPTPEAIATDTLMSTPTLGAFDPSLGTPTAMLGVLYSDDFSDTGSGWYEGSLEDREYHYQKGEYVILIKRDDWVSWASWQKEEFTNFTLEADVRLVEGPDSAEMGLIFRLREQSNFYYFRISGYSQYIVGRDVNGEWQDLAGIELTTSPHIKTGGATNRLKVVCQGPQIALYVNSHHLTTVSDVSFAEGKIGLIAAAVEHSEPVKVAFDNLVVSVVEDMP